MRHGAKSGYSRGCRCDECREASRISRKEWRDRNRAANTAAYQRELAIARTIKERHRGTCEDCGSPTSWSDSSRPIKRCAPCSRAHVAAQHGTRSKYNAGCRCDDCRHAAREAHRKWRALKRAAT